MLEEANKKRFRLPPLSDTLTRLLALDEEQRLDVRCLELLVNRDPVARYAILQAANSAYFGGVKCETTNAAIQRLGAQNTVMLLMSLWSLKELQVSERTQACRSWMCLRSVSLFATVKRILNAAELRIEPLELQLFVLSDVVGFASALSVHEHERDLQENLIEHSQHQSAHLHFDRQLKPLLERLPIIGMEWNMPPSVQEWLNSLTPEHYGEKLPWAAQALILAEILLSDNTKIEESEHQTWMESVFERLPLTARLQERQVRLTNLVVKF